MPQLTEKQVKKFQKIWKKEFGEEISTSYAFKRGTELVDLIRILCKTKPKKRNN